MKTSKFSDEQIVMALRQAEAGTPVGEICRKLGVSEQSFYRWNSFVNARRLHLAMDYSYRTFVRSGVSTKPGDVHTGSRLLLSTGEGAVAECQGIGAPVARNQEHEFVCDIVHAASVVGGWSWIH